MHFIKIQTKVISYRDLKKFDNEKFLFCLLSVVINQNHENNVEDPDIFFRIYQEVLSSHASRKKKYNCENEKLL